MILMLALAVLCLVAAIGAIVVAVHDSRGPARTIQGYDTRRPLP